jgi:hypothetical protein
MRYKDYYIEAINGPLWPIYSAGEGNGGADRLREIKEMTSKLSKAQLSPKPGRNPTARNGDAPKTSKTGGEENISSTASSTRNKGGSYRYLDNYRTSQPADTKLIDADVIMHGAGGEVHNNAHSTRKTTTESRGAGNTKV